MAASPEPDPFADSFTAAITSRALSTATMLGVFDALAEREATAAELQGLSELLPSLP